MSRLKQKYIQEIVHKMKELYHYSNILAVPRLEKIVINVGISSSRLDDKYQALVGNVLERISGQKAVYTKAKKSVSAFRIREDSVVGAKVTLRKNRMYDFLDKLINLTLPNVRDFRGIPNKSIDKNGNLTIGFKEYLAFPEINPDEVENVHGLEVVIHTTAKDSQEAYRLLSLLGVPFKDKLKIDK